jgi:hypothetical protein
MGSINAISGRFVDHDDHTNRVTVNGGDIDHQTLAHHDHRMIRIAPGSSKAHCLGKTRPAQYCSLVIVETGCQVERRDRLMTPFCTQLAVCHFFAFLTSNS